MLKNRRNEINWIIRDKYDGKIKKSIKNDFSRLKNGEPIDYIIGWKPFLNCHIDLSSRPLIPRPETEYWTEKVIKEIKTKKGHLKILDLFSGSGCIGLAVAKNTSNTSVDFADKNSSFLVNIKKNIRLNKIKKTKTIKTNIFSNINKKYDFILANPPYVSPKEKVGKSVKKWEPRSAIFAKNNGAEIIEKFFKKAQKHLKQGGVIYLEFSPKQKMVINKILIKNAYKKWGFFKDQFGRWRFLRVQF